MNIIIQDIKNNKYDINIKSGKTTVKELKLEIQKIYGLDLNEKNLLYKGKKLSDGQSLENYLIKEGATILMLNKSNNTTQNNNSINTGNKKLNEEINFYPYTNFFAKYSNNNNINNNFDIYNEINISKELKIYAVLMKILTVNDPKKMSLIINNLKQNNLPILYQIQKNEKEFIKILSSPIVEGDIAIFRNNYMLSKELLGTNLQEEINKGKIEVILDEKESEMIHRIKKLGNFSTEDIIVAYMINDKDEEKIKKYLLEKIKINK